jgi:hypothetical protein
MTTKIPLLIVYMVTSQHPANGGADGMFVGYGSER